MFITTTPARVARLLALSEAAEFLMCAVRSLALDHPAALSEADAPVRWALAKIEEAQVLPLEGR